MKKRLYKNSSQAKISGVCQGFAEYFNLDATLVRILWFVCTWFSMGIGLALYIVCAIILPDKTEIGFDDYSVSDDNE